MTCDESRELIGADPETTSAELLAHLQTCADCRAYREEMLALSSKIRRALELDLRPRPRAVATGAIPLSGARRRRLSARGVPIAVGLAAGVLAALALWLSWPSESLAAAVVSHVEGEPESWSQTQPLTPDAVEAVLRKTGVRMGPGMEPVVYASRCWFRGHFVPHFVVKTADGPVTVMILLKEHIERTQQFSEAGYSGLLVPAGSGSVAVLSRTPMSLEKPAEEVVHALQSAHN